MERFPVEVLVYGAIFLLILVFNYLSRRAQSQKPAPSEIEYEPIPEEKPYPEYEPSPDFWGRVPQGELVRPAPSPSVERAERARALYAQQAPKRYTRRSLLGSKNDLRRAVVLMTVLGPCLGAESSERRH